MAGDYLASRGIYILRQVTKRIWFRASLFSVAAIVTALVAAWIAPLIPYELSLRVGGKAVDNILTILASSMLAVTTFALSASVTAYGSATSAVTPRATQLLVDDRFTQNALSTFVGAFLFSIVGIIALTTGLYGAQGRVVLFFATIVIVAIIAITLLRWIQHLSSFGRVRDTIERVETVARRAMQAWAEAPHLGAQAPVAIPPETSPVYPAEIGYVAHIDVAGLARIADRHTLTIHIAELPGAFVFTERPLAHVAGVIDDKVRAAIEKTFSILTDREFEQDPRFGLIVLSEIASRALSPAVNDPGTAIRVLGAGQRVLSDLVDTKRRAKVEHLRVHAPALEVDDMFDDFFRPIARDGASIIEVQLRLLATLNGLATHAPGVLGETARRNADAARLRAAEALAFDGDRQAMRKSAR
ncbi:hypothetical protein HMP09_3271 [Sphingomonas sp. HMP9]|uniref:DUF2254 domain-containing protein n=1 Tax=Sphingomonas sp. HMP9 TaxID=1517554 RepID=UPI001597D0F7|nr:DUF2254 domain-containing protein [Sphingomonas sp. HMP9]BCA64037.1 hypothetical protein HMP09_3271 [Sphingomonas sp. HMP9]